MVISSVWCFVFYNFSKTVIGRQANQESHEKYPWKSSLSYIKGVTVHNSAYFLRPSLSVMCYVQLGEEWVSLGRWLSCLMLSVSVSEYLLSYCLAVTKTTKLYDSAVFQNGKIKKNNSTFLAGIPLISIISGAEIILDRTSYNVQT